MMRLLIVDDEKTINEGIKSGIDWEGYGIHVCKPAYSAMEALEYITEEPVDILILDISMPEMSGLELLSIVNQRYPKIKVILISAYREFDYAREAIKNNAFSYIVKPIDIDLLVAAVMEAKANIEMSLALFKNDSVIHRRAQENMNILKDNFLLNLIKGNSSNWEYIRFTAESLGVPVASHEFCTGVIELCTGEEGRPGSMGDEALLKSIIMNKIERMIASKCYCHLFINNDHLGLFFAGDSIDKQFLKEKLLEAKLWLNREVGIHVAMSIGSVCTDVFKLPLSYKKALIGIEYRHLMGMNEIIDIAHNGGEKFLSREAGSLSLYQQMKSHQRALLKAFIQGDTALITEFISNLCEKIGDTPHKSTEDRSRLFFELSFFFYNLLCEVQVYAETEETHAINIYEELLNCATAEEIGACLRERIFAVVNRIRSNKTSQNAFLVNKALDYMRTNVYSYFSLVDLAEVLNIHPNYLSKIFKQVLKTSFTDQMIGIKMDEAKRLLKETNLKIIEISQMLKYNDAGYFIRLFKKNMGVSPSDYRQLVQFREAQ